MNLRTNQVVRRALIKLSKRVPAWLEDEILDWLYPPWLSVRFLEASQEEEPK